MGGHSSQSSSNPVLNGISVNQSIYGKCIPLAYGTNRIPSNLIWYGNFQAVPVSNGGGGKGGGGGSGNSQYNYTAAIMMALCEGPIPGVGQCWLDKKVDTLANQDFTLFTGAGGQAVWSYLTSNYPAQAIPYDHTAYVVSTNNNFQLGNSAGIPNATFEVQGLQIYGSGFVDAEPSAILTDYLTDANHGAGFSYLGSMTNYQNYCIAMGFFLSPAETSQRTAVDFIQELLDITNSAPVWQNGTLNFIPYADAAVTGNAHSYTPNMSPLFSFTDDDYIYEQGTDPVTCSRTANSDVYNVIRVEYLDRTNQYNTAIAEAKDDHDIAIRGERVKSTITYHSITLLSVARQVAQLILQRQLYVRNTYQFKVRADYCLLEPMDLVSITDSGLGLTNQLVRITEIDDDADDNITITAEEVPIGIANAPIYNWQATQGYAANYGLTPGSVNTPVMFNAPPLLTGTGAETEVWIAVSGGPNWGGCNVYVSADNTNFVFAGSQYGPARYGTLTSTLASHADPDSTDTLAILLNDTALQLNSGTTADADNMRLLAYVDGEIISYSTATLTGAGAYNITYLRRGCYGSTIASHASGSNFVRMDANLIRVPFDIGMLGQTLYFKFQSFNLWGHALEDISTLSSYSHTLSTSFVAAASSLMSLVPRGNCALTTYNSAYKANGTSGWDSDVYTKESYANGCYLNFRASNTAYRFMMGLNTDPTTDQSYTSLDYAFDCSASSATIQIYESGTLIGSFGTYTNTTQFQIKYDGFFVTYLVDAVVKRIVANPGQKFSMDSSFYGVGASANSIDFGPLTPSTPAAFVARGNCVISDNNVQKIGGTAAWDSDFYSISGYKQCHISFKANQTNADFMIGLNSDPTTDQSYTSIDYAMRCDTSGVVEIYESGTQVVANAGSYTTSSVMAITYDGSTITYYINNVSVRTVSVSGLTLFADSSFNTVGGGANTITFGPNALVAVSDTPQIGANAATDIAVSTVGLVNINTSSVSRAALATVSVGPYPYVTEVILTLTGTVQLAASSSTGEMQLHVALDTTSSGTNNNDVAADNNTQTSQIYAFAREYSFSLAANTTQSYYASGTASVALGPPVTVPVSNITMKAEVIKR